MRVHGSPEIERLEKDFRRIIDQETIVVDIVLYLEAKAGYAFTYRDEAKARSFLDAADEVARHFEFRRRQEANDTITRLNELANRSYPLRSTIPEIVKNKRPG